MKQAFKIIFGLVMIAAGLLWILNLAGVIVFDFSLDGWWAFFVIIPCLAGTIAGPDRIGSAVFLSVGILLLLCARGILEWADFWQFALAALVIGIGIKLLIFKGNCACKVTDWQTINREGKDIPRLDFQFSKQTMDFDKRQFEGADVKVAFGTIELDLRGAIIESDAELKVDVSFGSVRVYLPDEVSVKTYANYSFAAFDDDRRRKAEHSGPTFVITGQVAFGGVEIR